MLKRFLRSLSQSFCLYLLTALNVVHAVEKQSYDWLLWMSLALTLLSMLLNLLSAIRGGKSNG